jgi:hypothetical protein
MSAGRWRTRPAGSSRRGCRRPRVGVSGRSRQRPASRTRRCTLFHRRRPTGDSGWLTGAAWGCVVSNRGASPVLSQVPGRFGEPDRR